jgi:hypothetical protein
VLPVQLLKPKSESETRPHGTAGTVIYAASWADGQHPLSIDSCRALVHKESCNLCTDMPSSSSAPDGRRELHVLGERHACATCGSFLPDMERVVYEPQGLHHHRDKVPVQRSAVKFLAMLQQQLRTGSPHHAADSETTACPREATVWGLRVHCPCS